MSSRKSICPDHRISEQTGSRCDPGSDINIGQKVSEAAKRFVFFLLTVLVLTTSALPCEGAADWIYEPETESSSEIWTYLAAHDEALDESLTYRPVLCLGANDEIQSWLVSSFAPAEDPSDPDAELPAGNYVVYVQLFPCPKIISLTPAGTPIDEIIPVCEIKLLLDSDSMLDEEHRLREEWREEFQTGEGYQTISAVYLDTPEKDYLSAGWVNRIRVKEGKPKYTITYKKRYPVENDDIEAAFDAARSDGFSLYDNQFPAEIDWGYSQMTLSFSADADVKTAEIPDINFLEPTDAAQMFAERMPSEENDWESAGWGKEMTDRIRIAGPVHFLRYSGSIDGQSIRIEIWPVPADGETEYIVEFSAEGKTLKEAAVLRQRFIAQLDETGILLHRDALKTDLILNGIGANQ